MAGKKLSRKSILNYLMYSWWKYVALVVVCVLGVDVLFTMTAYRVPEEKKVRFDMEETLGQVLITFEKKINDKGLNVDVDMPAYPVITHACEDYVTQIIYNLIDNAVKFCPQGRTSPRCR